MSVFSNRSDGLTPEQDALAQEKIEALREQVKLAQYRLLVARFDYAARTVLPVLEEACAERKNFSAWNALTMVVTDAEMLL